MTNTKIEHPAIIKELIAQLGNEITEASVREAYETLEDMKSAISDGDSPEDVVQEYGLDSDYAFDLLIEC